MLSQLRTSIVCCCSSRTRLLFDAADAIGRVNWTRRMHREPINTSKRPGAVQMVLGLCNEPYYRVKRLCNAGRPVKSGTTCGSKLRVQQRDHYTLCCTPRPLRCLSEAVDQSSRPSRRRDCKPWASELVARACNVYTLHLV